MKNVYDITIKANFYVLAESHEEATQIAQDEVEGIDSFLPARSSDFTFTSYNTPCQEEFLKKQAINYTKEK